MVEDEKKSDYESRQQQQEAWSDERTVKGMKNNNNLHYYHCIG